MPCKRKAYVQYGCNTKFPFLKMQMREHHGYIVQNYLSQAINTSLKLVNLARSICKSLTVSKLWAGISKHSLFKCKARIKTLVSDI